jgi:parallel beta-helix repeat protein
MRFPRVLRAAGPALLSSLAVLLAPPATAAADPGCARVAAPTGSDAAAGTEAAPFRTAQKLVDSLSAGQAGCLRAGTYEGNLRFNRGRVTLRSYAGERARVVGRVYVPRGSDGVTVSDLDLNGRNSETLPSPTVNASDTTFTGNDVTTDHTAICFVLGNAGYGRAVRTLIQRNRIHDCGVLPAQNHHHGIYVSDADDTRILENWIYDNADRGIQLYPDAQRTTIRGNVIDGNGQGIIFSGAGGSSSNDTVVENNVITNSKIRYDVESWYPSGTPAGTGNVVRHNCIHGGERGEIQSPQVGFSVSSNVIADPGYADRAGKDFRLASGSRCAEILGGAAAPPGAGSGGDSADRPADDERASRTSGGGRKLRLSRVSVRASGARYVLTVRGRASRRLQRRRTLAFEVSTGGSWRRIAYRRLKSRFRYRLSPRLGSVRASSVIRVRAVVPGAARSEPVTVRVR